MRASDPLLLPSAGDTSTAAAPVTSSGEVGLDMQLLLDVQSVPGEPADDGRDDEASDGAAEDKLWPGEEFSGI